MSLVSAADVKLTADVGVGSQGHNTLHLYVLLCHPLVSNLAFRNARSLTNKTHAVTDLVVDNNLDVLVITESWLSGGQ